MEIKKSPKADLRNKRGLLLEIGLVISLCLVIGAFAYTPKERKIEKMDLQTAVERRRSSRSPAKTRSLPSLPSV